MHQFPRPLLGHDKAVLYTFPSIVPVPRDSWDTGQVGVGGCTAQPDASTVVPVGVPGHLSRLSGTPSRSVSCTGGCTAQPEASTVVPVGVPGHLSRLSGTPSRSVSSTGGGGGCGLHTPLWACAAPWAERLSVL